MIRLSHSIDSSLYGLLPTDPVQIPEALKLLVKVTWSVASLLWLAQLKRDKHNAHLFLPGTHRFPLLHYV